MIKHVDSSDVDFEKLAHLQELHADNLFCHSAYFEPLFERWCALVSNDYAGVLIVPYQKFGPWKWSFTPLFYRATPWLGAWSEEEKKELSKILLNLKFR